MSAFTWYKIDNQHVSINILAKPNARKTNCLGLGEQGLIVSLHAKPHEGEANKELIAFLAKLLDLPKSKVILKKGKESRHKQVVVPLTLTVQKWIDDMGKEIPS